MGQPFDVVIRGQINSFARGRTVILSAEQLLVLPVDGRIPHLSVVPVAPLFGIPGKP